MVEQMSEEQSEKSFQSEDSRTITVNHSENDAMSIEKSSQYRDNGASSFFLAGFWMRFWAYLIDIIVVGSVTRLLINPIFRAMDVSLIDTSMFAPIAIMDAVVFYGYFILMTKYFSQTIGKMVLGLKVIELNGSKPSWGTVVFRELIGRFISATVLILYIVVAFTNKKQGIHDLFADTTVVQEKKRVQFKPAS
jgi:uncharacterized RDD family membrane protein YckC